MFAIFLAIYSLFFCRIASYHEARNRMREITTHSARVKFSKEKKALKTTSFVIGLVLLCHAHGIIYNFSRIVYKFT